MTTRTILGALLLGTVAAGCGGTPTEDAAQSATSALTNVSYAGSFMAFGGSFTPPYADLCIATSGAGLVTQYCSTYLTAQTFHLYNNNAVTDSTGRCIQGNASGAVTLATCNGSYTQKWDIQGGNIVWLNDESMCIDVANGASALGTAIDLVRCDGLPQQSFWPAGFTLAIASTMADSTNGKTQCLDVHYDGEYAGNFVDNYDCNQSNAQYWVLNQSGQITLADNPSLCLAPSVGNPTLEPCSGGTVQSWTFANLGYDSALVSVKYGTCLTVADGSRSPGQVVDMEGCAQTNDQRWVPTPIFQTP